MTNEVEPQLTKELLELFKSERFVTVATVDYESKIPVLTAISWIFAPHPSKLRFAVDNRSRVIQNLRINNGLSVNIIGNGSTYSISGKASIIVEKIQELPLKISLVEVEIAEVRDIMFYGSQISVDPQYEKTYDLTAAQKLDKQVMGALKSESR